jgi:hypothetical protein
MPQFVVAHTCLSVIVLAGALHWCLWRHRDGIPAVELKKNNPAALPLPGCPPQRQGRFSLLPPPFSASVAASAYRAWTSRMLASLSLA